MRGSSRYLKLVLENAVTMDLRYSGPDSVIWTRGSEHNTRRCFCERASAAAVSITSGNCLGDGMSVTS